MPAQVPAYFDFLIDGFQEGLTGRFVHLGHWDEPPLRGTPPRPGAFERAQERLNDIVLALADLHDGQSILDLGCGFGGTLDRIDRSRSHMCLVGVDIDPRQLEICRQLRSRAANRFDWIETDACSLPFPADCFDRVLCVEAAFHFSSRRRFFQEAARVLRPGGVLAISDIAVASAALPPEMPRAVMESNLRGGYGPWPDVWGDEGDHRGLAAAAGLTWIQEIDATQATLPSHRFTAPSDVAVSDDVQDPMLRAAVTLKWLHEEGHLRYVYGKFAKTVVA